MNNGDGILNRRVDVGAQHSLNDDSQEPYSRSTNFWNRFISDWNPITRLGLSRFALLCVVTTAQVLTIIITWPLWQVRDNDVTPNLPFVEILNFDYGTIVLASTLLVLLLPRKGIWINLGTFAIASLEDQMRLQPQFLANWLLMYATVSPNGTRVARLFLISLWFWAGLHKFLSPDWFTYASWNLTNQAGFSPADVYYLFAIVVATSELGLGILAFFKPRWAAIACPFLHVGIAIFLSPLFRDWNYSVIPWNLSMAVVGWWILWFESSRSKWKPWEFFMFAVVMVAPAGFYLGLTDHGYAHVLYSNHLPRGHITKSDGDHYEIDGWGDLAVPFPNERRLLKQYFEAVSQPGDKLHIRDPRPVLPDQFFVMAEFSSNEIDKQQFFSKQAETAYGVGIDDKLSIFLLTKEGVGMLVRNRQDMVYAVKFNSSNYSTELLRLATELPNLEQIQLSGTPVSDKDLKLLYGLKRLEGIGLLDTKVSRGALTELLLSVPTIESLETDHSL